MPFIDQPIHFLPLVHHSCRFAIDYGGDRIVDMPRVLLIQHGSSSCSQRCGFGAEMFKGEIVHTEYSRPSQGFGLERQIWCQIRASSFQDRRTFVRIKQSYSKLMVFRGLSREVSTSFVAIVEVETLGATTILLASEFCLVRWKKPPGSSEGVGVLSVTMIVYPAAEISRW